MITVTVPSTSETIVLPPLNMTGLQIQIKRQIPKPEPPLQKINLFGEETIKPNPFAQEYLDALEQWDTAVNELVAEAAFRKIAYAQPLDDEKRRQVADLREQLGDLVQIPENDKLAWFYNFAMPDGEEMGLVLQSAVTQTNRFLSTDAPLVAELDGTSEPNTAEMDFFLASSA
ncbi:MAG: hypothetical protein KDD89_00920 [Anaerolineales bacterium]|nr:hypothetical protein [Anaerolineales bacterium]